MQVGNVGTAGNGEFASASFTANNLTLGNAYANAFTFAYTGTLDANGNIVSTDTPLTFPNPVVLQMSNTFSTVATTGADITFSSTLDGAAADTFGLVLNAGNGNINFGANVGGNDRLSSLTLASAFNVNLAATATMEVDSLFQLNGFGTTTFNGPLIVPTAVGITLTGNNFAFNNLVETSITVL